jgi:hypothetical protein
MTTPSASRLLNSSSEISHQILDTFVRYNVPISNKEQRNETMESWSLLWTKAKTHYDKEIIDNKDIEDILNQR